MPKLLQAVACALLCCALRGASAVTYGQPGVGSQYQLFGSPIADTSVHRSSPLRGIGDTVFAVTADDAQKPAASACDSGFVYSEVFGKCLPERGKDGYIGKAYDEQAKGKGAAESSAFVPISANMPLRAAALSSATNEPPQHPQQPSRGAAQPSPRGRAIVAPVRQLRLACPPGFGFEPAMGACIAPAAALQQQAMRMRMNRPRSAAPDSDNDDNRDDDDSDELRREHQHMFGGGRRFHRRMFGRRFGFGGPRILAPVFVFVLPPLDRNASRIGVGLGLGDRTRRVHEIHPSLVGPIGGATAQPAAPTPATAVPEKPIAPVPKATENEPKPTPGPKGATGETGALRGAFVNPIVGSGKSLPLKSQSAVEAPWMRLKRRAFVSPLIQSSATDHSAASP